MGKGKRNRLLHVEDNAVAPKKQNKAKKQFIMPVWAKRAICIALLVAVLAGIIVAAVIGGGAILRGRVVVESKTGKYDMNQQMATFILWQTMFQQASYEWQNAYYQQYFGGTKNEILTKYQSPEQYGITMAAYYTKEALNSGLTSIKDYLIELVAGADAAEKAGLKFDAQDKESVQDVVSWMQNIYVNLGFNYSGIPFKNFLSEYVGETFKTSDIEDAAKIMIMYSKYSDYVSFNMQDDPSKETLQDYILKNPAGFFETKYYSFTSADQAMIRDFFTDEFMTERFESTVAKYYANVDRLAVMNLKDEALTAKLAELGLDNAVKYTRTANDDGEYTYSPELIEVLGEYIFGTSNKAGTFAAISGEKCAYLVYYKETSTATEATVAVREYKYEDYKDTFVLDMGDEKLNTIDLIYAALADSIVAGESTTEYRTDNEKAAELLGKLNDDNTMNLPEGAVEVVTTKPVETNDPNTAPKSILDAMYAKDVTPVIGWNFVVNDTTESYVVKVVSIKKDPETGKDTDSYVISYVTIKDDFFASALATFEAEFNLYLLETKYEAPKYSMTFADFEKKAIEWLIEENYKELVLNRYATADHSALLTAKADSNKEVLTNKVTEIFGADAIKTFTKSNALQTEFKTKYDSNVYDYIFNSSNKDSFKVITGKDDRVFLVYVTPVAENEPGHEGHDHTNTVHVAIKEYNLADYAEKLNYTYTKDSKEETKTFAEQILADLLSDGRKNSTTYKSAEELAKAELDALKATENAKEWAGYATIGALKPLEKNDTNTVPSVILNKIYPNGSKATKIDLTANTFYQVDDNGTSYVFKITDINTTTLACNVEYKLFEDEEYYSYFRSIKTKVDASLKETSTTLKYPESITAGSYQEWLFKGEFKDNNRTFDRVKDDLTFIANVDSKNNVTSLNIYIVDEPAVQKNDEEMTVYAAFQLYETEKEAQKALNKLKGLTSFELLDMFTSFKQREEMDETNEEGYFPGYVITTSPSISVDFTKADISDENLKNWLFDATRKADDVAIVQTKDGKGYYLVAFSSTEQAWLRNARTGWINESFKNHIEELVKDYEINEAAMEKIEGVITTTTASTTTAN